MLVQMSELNLCTRLWKHEFVNAVTFDTKIITQITWTKLLNPWVFFVKFIIFFPCIHEPCCSLQVNFVKGDHSLNWMYTNHEKFTHTFSILTMLKVENAWRFSLLFFFRNLNLHGIQKVHQFQKNIQLEILSLDFFAECRWNPDLHAFNLYSTWL